MQSALITGAAGFIGSRLAARLRDAGTEVRGLDRATNLKLGITASDIAEADVWQGAAAGSEVVIHTAALVTNTASYEQAWRTNVLGTRNVLDAAIAAGARRFVHLSSVRAFGDRFFPDGVTEDYPVRPDGHTYVDTKIASEQVVLQAHAAGEIECTVLRPGDVYGPGSRPWTVLPVDAIRQNRFFLPAMGRGIFSPVYIDNMLDGIVLAAERDEAAGQVITLTDGTGVPCREFFGHYSRMLGKPAPRVVPTAVAMGLAALPEAAAWIGGTTTEFRRSSVIYLARPGTYSTEKARRLLGFAPAVDLAEGMARTEKWLGEQGFLA
jgi:nucleoside-diphosphate-sugar epimerase